MMLAAAALVMGVATTARADDKKEGVLLKVGTLAPGESPWGKVFKVWQKGVKERTSGALELQFFWNGQQGDELAMVGKIRTGQLDGAAITATGLSQIYKHILVLQLPGLYRDWSKLDAARNALRPQVDPEFEKAGFRIVGYGDVGMAHIMSNNVSVKHPNDLKGQKTFYLAGDPISSTFLSVVGDNTPKQLSVPEILPALTSNTVNVINSPALAAEQLQWASRLDHINTMVSGVGIGGLVFSSSKLNGLPADLKAALLETGKVAGEALTASIRREDAAAFERLKGRMTKVEPSPEDIAAWNKIFEATRNRLKGSTFNAAIFDAAVAAAN
jgi:TRAP-type C4-dicarboxylate transport system substrate-binding protein